MSSLLQDLRRGTRLAASRPGFTAIAVLALALGIGPNTAIFSVVNSLLLQPPPYPDADRIVATPQVTQAQANTARPSLPSSDDFQDWRRETRTMSSMAISGPDSLTLTGFGDPVRLDGARVSPAIFSVLGVTPMLGRTFTESEEMPGAPPVVIVGEKLWVQRLGRDPAIVGKPIVLDGVGRQVIGVMPATFGFPTRETEYWAPYTLTPPERGGNQRRVAITPVVGRLKPGVSIEQASAEGNTILSRNNNIGLGGPGGGVSPAGPGGPSAAPPPPRLPLRLVTLQERQVGQLRGALLVLLAAVGLVLLIACANVANLLLSRVTSRRREMAIRAALGASRGRIVGQMLAENVILAVLGGGIGVLLAVWVVRLLPRLSGQTFTQLNEVRLDWRALLFAALISVVATLLFGLAPAVAAARRGLADSIKQRSAAGTGGFGFFGRNSARSALTVTQIGLALMLTVGAGLLARSLFMLVGQNLGYRPESAFAVQVQLPNARYPQPQARTAFLDQLLAGVRTIPGVEAAGATNLMPMSQAQIRLGFGLPGTPGDANPNDPMLAGARLVSPGFFKALGTRLLAGREFAETDHATGEQVVVINQALATRYMGGLDPIGRQIDLGGPRRIVGLVESLKPRGFDSEPVPEIYFPLTQFDQILMSEGPLAATTIVVRTSGDPASLAGAVRTRVARLDPQLPLFNIMTLAQRVSSSVAQPRFYAIVLALFAALALVLTAVGIYGVLTSQVAQSTREIGIQMALGAAPGRIRLAVLTHGAVLASVGVGIGLAGSWGLSRFLAALLFGITPMDVTSYAGAAVALGFVALAGVYVPARRATQVDPVVALRCE